jgi:hypothetical protein
MGCFRNLPIRNATRGEDNGIDLDVRCPSIATPGTLTYASNTSFCVLSLTTHFLCAAFGIWASDDQLLLTAGCVRATDVNYTLSRPLSTIEGQSLYHIAIADHRYTVRTGSLRPRQDSRGRIELKTMSTRRTQIRILRDVSRHSAFRHR